MGDDSCLKSSRQQYHSIQNLLNFLGSWSVTLHDILGPSEVQNNSLPYVVLDCDFSINLSEREGMILKWYLNGKTIYQWIPPRRPQVSTMSARFSSLSCPDIPSYSWFMVLLIYSSVWALVTEPLSPLHIFTSSFSLSTA